MIKQPQVYVTLVYNSIHSSLFIFQLTITTHHISNMSSAYDAITTKSNAAFHHAGDMVEHLLGQAMQLNAADPQHIDIAMQMARGLVSFFFASTLLFANITIVSSF